MSDIPPPPPVPPMHPRLTFAARFGPGIASWLLAHRDELGDAWGRLAEPVTDALAGTARIDRVGNTLVAVTDGQTRVIGLLHRHSARLDSLQAGIDGLWAG